MRDESKLWLLPYDEDRAVVGHCLRWLRSKPKWTLTEIERYCDQLKLYGTPRAEVKRNLIHAYGALLLGRAAGALEVEYTNSGTPFLTVKVTLGDLVNED